MTVIVLEPATRTVRCTCGALLRYGVEDVRRVAPPAGMLCTHMAVMGGGWPWVACPQCDRAVLVSGCW